MPLYKLFPVDWVPVEPMRDLKPRSDAVMLRAAVASLAFLVTI